LIAFHRQFLDINFSILTGSARAGERFPAEFRYAQSWKSECIFFFFFCTGFARTAAVALGL
jgi:hypothetical protein